MPYKDESKLRPRLTKAATTLAAFVSIVLSAPSMASDAAAVFGLSLRELLSVKVTVASRFEESELDVASSVSVVTQADWKARGARRVSDALESVPSVVALPTWGGAEAIAIRGYATELSVRGIANTLDGVPLNSFNYASSFYDKPVINLGLLERIEVIRGPGSTLYGSDAFHGVLSYQTRDSETDAQELEVAVGAPGYSSNSLFTSSTLAAGRIHVGVSSQQQGRQDLDYHYTNPYNGEQESGTRDNSFRDVSAFITYETGDKKHGYWRLNTYASNYEAKGFPGIGSQFFTGFEEAADLASASILRDRDRSDQDSDFVLGQVDYGVNLTSNMELGAQLYHWESKREWRFDNSRYLETFGPFPCLTAPDPAAVYPFYCPHELQQGDKERRSGIQAHINHELSDLDTRWVYGAGIDRLKITQSFFRRIAPSGDVYIDSQNNYKGDERTIRFAFAQGSTALLNDRLQLVYGIRVDDYSDVGSHTSPRLGLIYRIGEFWTSKLLYGHAFRAPTANERAGSADNVFLANPNIKPEEIDTYEWVNIFQHARGQTQLTAFTSRWEEGIVLQPTGNAGNSQYINTGKNKSYGLELSTRHQIEAWTLLSATSYVRSKNQNSGLDYSAFPRWLMSLEARYKVPGEPVSISLYERVMAHYRQADSLSDSPAERSRQYYRTDLGINYTLGDSGENQNQLFANILNILGRDNTLPAAYNAEGGLPDLDRQLVVGLRLSF